jgi:hypothetical protein
MPDEHDRKITPSAGGGVFQGLALRVKLILRLLGDPRVNPLLKVLPIGSLIYLVIPDLAPGPLDDAAIIWLGTYLFVELCPQHVVEEHMQALTSVVPGEWSDPLDEEIVDAEFTIKD